jgi:tetratricopeptide (TPR) repeat protein/predicted Ser/Thr protein kinase
VTCLADATVLDLVEGRLPEAQLAQIDEHLDSCTSCRAVVTALARGDGGERVLARGENLGRFVIGDLLGAGAMGRVYSAWEPELDRRVAIKVLRNDHDRERLLREAQAMARLNHPHVVTVYEAGTAEQGVFVAMELVAGSTLRAWAREHHAWRARARLLGDIAGGLSAVHGAGVIHRDMKPDNVIVGDDGRVRIGDFGLARSDEEATSGERRLASGTATSVAGTPAYMAPEVLRGGVATEASDQFSFGVTAYEVLAGRRPFAAQTWGELVAEIERGQIARLRQVPGWLDELVRRCLAVDPARRHRGVAEVATRLARGVARRSPVVWLAGGLALATLASGATWYAMHGAPAPARSCAVGDIETARVWTARERAVFAEYPAVSSAIERWLAAWAAERDAACAATLPPPRLAARERCLDQRLAEVSGMLATLTRGEPDPRALTGALDALAVLPAPADCRSEDVSVADAPPVEPARAARVGEVEQRLPVLRAQVALRRVFDADAPKIALSERTAALVEVARASGHAPTLADTLTVHAEALRTGGNLGDAAVAARDAVAAAERGHADALAAQAWLARVAIAVDRRELESADDLGAIAQASADRAGSQPNLSAALLRLRGLVAYNRGHLDEARTLLTQARTAWFSLAGEHSLQVAQVDAALGSVARAAGDLDEAERRHRAALALDRELRGPAHPDVARDLHNIAGVLRLRGDLDQALATYREALAIETATEGESPIAGLTHNSIGLVLMARKQWREARVELTAARDALARAGHGDRAFAEHNLGLVAQALNDHREALDHFDRADRVYTATIGNDATAPIRLLIDRARSELALADPISAREHALAGRQAAREHNLEWLESDANAVLAKLAGATWTAPPPSGVETNPPSTTLGSAAPVPPIPPPQPPKPPRDIGVYGANQD